MSGSSDMQVFASVIACGTFSAAADDLGITPSAVSRTISRLEERLGARLIHRTTRRLSLTPEGEAYHQRARGILAAIAEAEAEVSRSGHPRGLLRINSVAPFAHFYLAQAIPEFLSRYPRIEVELKVTDRLVDLLSEGADVALRTGRIDEPSLVVKKISDIDRGIYVSPIYLARRGAPQSPDDLARHDCIRLSSVASSHLWPFRTGDGTRLVNIGSRISADNTVIVLQLATAGAGIARLTNLTTYHAVRNGDLVPLFADLHAPEPYPLSAIYPSGRQRMPKVRAFLDFLQERFARAPWRTGSQVREGS